MRLRGESSRDIAARRMQFWLLNESKRGLDTDPEYGERFFVQAARAGEKENRVMMQRKISPVSRTKYWA